MTEKEAYKILGISPEAEKSEVKKRYRQLMMQVHPDSGGASGKKYAYDAQEINIAYAVLSRGKTVGGKAASHGSNKSAAEGKQREAWDAPVNENAYREREVLLYAEDHDGAVLGNFCVARGKYLWKPEEDFPLFLLSLYRCGRQLLDEIDSELHREAPAVRHRTQAELTYLLAQQFIDGTALLKEFAKEERVDQGKDRIFHISSMIELSDKKAALEAGEALYPSVLRKHKLYLKNKLGQELGYLSFQDDRLYYIVIPLFEQKRVQVKIRAAGRQEKKRHKPVMGYQNLHLWIKLSDTNTGSMPENLNLQIGQLLEKYAAQDRR